MKNYLKILHLDDHSLTPYHQQLSDAIMLAVERKQIEMNDVLPSINDLSIALDVSRNIIAKAYSTLKERGVVGSVHGKGHFIKQVDTGRSRRILMLFNKLSSQKKIIYDAFATSLGEGNYINFFIYNSNFNLFKKILFDKMDQFDKIVVAPHFVCSDEPPADVLNKIPEGKLILIGGFLEGINGTVSTVYEDFEQDIFDALSSMLSYIRNYHGITMVFPKDSYYSTGIFLGFLNFCKKFGCHYHIMPTASSERITKGMLYITLTDDDLLDLIAQAKEEKLVLKEDFGVISYNETPFKKFILNGITTISADFSFMGVKAAELVKSGVPERIKAPFYTTIRPSI
ncbi:GntR family transcriptional regulator [Mucilaginibacter aquariorum]|uniref:GntR family transcriptional regulator n=1 Tax=Mucilaginibacter aquariorum TaxID=2967225 RepID=A0ABT1T810_9SPHI|nr:GntR family transcriptional regulator [Mucilaginibacter aquariorum]MCQ6960767.1 GntR family transcriptional regulator [Mucilaginibacter aquariorum]